MSDAADFIRAICEDTANDLPRLVYADYLDERGDGERAEFIRLQCEIDQLTKVGFQRGLTMDMELAKQERRMKLDQLRARELELLGAVSDVWAYPPENDIAGVHLLNKAAWMHPARELNISSTHVDFRRGFVHTIRCTAVEWQRQTPPSMLVKYQTIGQVILREQPVEEIQFEYWHGKLEIERGWTMTLTGVERQGEPYPRIVRFETRAALIDAMPQQLREWGVGQQIDYIMTADAFNRSESPFVTLAPRE